MVLLWLLEPPIITQTAALRLLQLVAHPGPQWPRIKPVLVAEVVKLPGVRGTSGTRTRFQYLLIQRHSVSIQLG